MAERSKPADESSTAAYLLASALHLQQAAVRAGRRDVAAKADEVVALLANADNPIDGNDRRRESNDAGNAILKILDGLGL
jgi:hypothetical protein